MFNFHNTIESFHTALKMAVPTTVGVVATFTDYEPIVRMISITITTSLSIAIFIINNRKIKQRKIDEKEID